MTESTITVQSASSAMKILFIITPLVEAVRGQKGIQALIALSRGGAG